MIEPVFDVVDRVLLGFAAHAPGWMVGLTAALVYGGCGLALPLSLRWRLAYLVEANVVSTIAAGAVCLAWILVRSEAADRRHLLDWTTNLRLLTSSEFEWLVGELFRREGYQVRETGRDDGPDGNIDLELTVAGQRKVVQCKRWQSWSVGVEEVRGFAGTLLREGLLGSAGVFVTLSNFTDQARDEAARTGIALIDNSDLHGRIEKVRRAEPCPACGTPMVLARSSYGWWLRCRSCPGKRDLAAEPGPAVDLLLKC
jgi:hypothetical protein